MSLNLPPQAYTRETLMQAFDWIRTQPKQIQELAGTSDALVSIYMQARRRGGQFTPTNPVSAQSFKQDLKNLAEGLRQFDGEESNTPSASVTAPVAPATAPAAPSQTLPPQQAQPQQAALSATRPASTAKLPLDEKSLEAVRSVQQRFNLSSESEALRALIALGYEKFREMSGKI